MKPNEIFARRVFVAAGVYGLLVTLPQLFLESLTSRLFPPAITHPEFYYGFVGTVLAWQVAFFVIGRDPVRHRPLMLAAVIEKKFFGTVAWILYLQDRVGPTLLAFAAVDLLFAYLFFKSWRLTRSKGRPAPEPVAVVADDESSDVLILDLRRAVDQSPH